MSLRIDGNNAYFFRFQYRIDARCIPSTLTDNHDVVWFQCPWKPHATYELICDFLLNLAEQIENGVYVCVGITKHEGYFKRYNLEKLFIDCEWEYSYLGESCELVNQILRFGYYHEGVRDIHERIRNYHATLVFKKKDYSPPW